MVWIGTWSLVKRTSQIHFLSRWFQSFSSGRYLSRTGFFLAWLRKASIVRPYIYGTAETFTAERFTYCKVSESCTYLLGTSGNLLEEEDVDSV